VENKYSLKGKVIIVTGGTGILGNSFVNGIVEAGGVVGILGRNEAVANERAETINKAGGSAIALIADVLNEEELMAAKTQVWDQFGRLDGLVNGAGGNMPQGVLQPEEDIFNYYPPRYLGRLLLKQGKGVL
jgi:NAD(P)-dependent dehydrogenase (short-subunit alcohol dehydrogenase family)